MLTPEQIAAIDGRLYNLTLTGTVPGAVGGAPGTLSPSKQIDSSFHFLSEYMYIIYPTLSAVGVDSGTSSLSAQFRSSQSQIFLSDDFIDLACIAAPGRQRTVGVAGDPSNSLHISGLPWFYPYPATSNLQIDLRNTSTQALIPFFDFKGYIVPVSRFPTVDDLLKFLSRMLPGYGVPDNMNIRSGAMPPGASYRGRP